ncbi:MAG: hypothetical protein JXQ67_09920 [Campylobacterales bacterium]|nr:hypothetical protein [Campylobacterales bacterium]
MGAKKIIKNIADFLNLTNFTINGKKRSLKDLLKKLKEKRVKILRALKNECSEEEEKALNEELELISFHIRKAKKKLEDLS